MFFGTRERLEIEGIMPERALLRLKRAGIDLYDVKKTQKNRILLSVKKKDSEKVFAIYPKVCYNITEYTPYTVRPIGLTGAGKYLRFIKNRIGFLLGASLFCACTLFADGMVFGVEFSASSVYAREAYAALEEYGVKPFARYESGNEDLICSKLLALEGVEFCSVKKTGMRVVVEIRLGELPSAPPRKGDMQAKHTGTLLAITALKGTPTKKVGDSVRLGETLVGAWFEVGEGERTEVEVVARASVACVYESEIVAEDEKQAFAIAYLEAGLTQEDTVTGTSVTERGESFFVTIEYTAIERMNF